MKVAFSVLLTVTLGLCCLISTIAVTEREAEGYLNSGNIEMALYSFKELVEEDPSNIFALQGLAISYSQIGQNHISGSLFEQAASLSQNFQLYFNAGLSYQRAGDGESALRSYSRCLELNGNMASCAIKMASIYRDMEDFISTQKMLLHAIAVNPKDPMSYRYLGDTYNNIKQFALAIDSYQKSLALSPNDPNVLVALGTTYSNMLSSSKALKTFQKALRVLSQSKTRNELYLESLLGVFFASIEMGYWKEYEANLHNLLEQVRQYDQFRRHHLQSFDPNSHGFIPPVPLSPHRLMFIDAPADIYRDVSQQWFEALTHSRSMASSVLQHQYEEGVMNMQNRSKTSSSSKLSVLYMSRRFYNYPGTQMLIRTFSCHNTTRFHVQSAANGPVDSSGYRDFIVRNSESSLDLASMTMEKSLESILSLHPDVIVDYDGLHSSNSLPLLSQLAISRPSMPIISWLGFAGPLGSLTIHHSSSLDVDMDSSGDDHANPLSLTMMMISDRQIYAPDIDHFQEYTEKMILLPDTYQPQDEFRGQNITWTGKVPYRWNRIPSYMSHHDHSQDQQHSQANFDSASMDRYQLRLEFLEYYENHQHQLEQKEGNDQLRDLGNDDEDESDEFDRESLASSLWFISFNRVSKITPDVFEDWMSLLLQSPHSILILMKENQEVLDHLQNQALFYGIQADRLVFLSRLSMVDYRDLLHLSDLFLDPRPYNAHTVASDSLGEGTPVATLVGQTFASRVAGSINDAMNMNDVLNFYSRKEMEDSLVRYSRSKNVFASLRHAVEREIGHQLFNSPRFTRHLEHGYQAAIDSRQIWSEGSHLIVGDSSGIL